MNDLSNIPKIPPIIIKKLSQYYKHRSEQHIIPWNKPADIDAIFKASSGWNVEACAGTFWFKKKINDEQVVIIEMYENNYQTGGLVIIENIADDKPEICKIIDKCTNKPNAILVTSFSEK
jgi:hypothetical protein